MPWTSTPSGVCEHKKGITVKYVCMNSQLQIHVEGLRTRRVLGRVCTCKSRLRGVYFGHSFLMILIRNPPPFEPDLQLEGALCLLVHASPAAATPVTIEMSLSKAKSKGG